ncbi:MAG TPA: hypothetical protein VF430_05650, partial [Verrucomicrobiae bacterium]
MNQFMESADWREKGCLRLAMEQVCKRVLLPRVKAACALQLLNAAQSKTWRRFIAALRRSAAFFKKRVNRLSAGRCRVATKMQIKKPLRDPVNLMQEPRSQGSFQSDCALRIAEFQDFHFRMETRYLIS